MSGTAERNFVWGGYSPFLKSLLCAKLKSTIYGKIIGGGGGGGGVGATLNVKANTEKPKRNKFVLPRTKLSL